MKNMKKINVEKEGLKVQFNLKEDRKSLILGRRKIQICLNGSAIIDVVPTRDIEEILILEGCKKHLAKNGLELPIISSPEEMDEFGICYDTETNEVRFFGGSGKEVKLQTPADWVIKFKCPCSWMNNQVWLNPAII